MRRPVEGEELNMTVFVELGIQKKPLRGWTKDKTYLSDLRVALWVSAIAIRR